MTRTERGTLVLQVVFHVTQSVTADLCRLKTSSLEVRLIVMPLGVSMPLKSRVYDNVNNRGNSRHPCLTPFLIGIGFLNLPLCDILPFDFLYCYIYEVSLVT
jgi:hypothetical protein